MNKLLNQDINCLLYDKHLYNFFEMTIKTKQLAKWGFVLKTDYLIDGFGLSLHVVTDHDSILVADISLFYIFCCCYKFDEYCYYPLPDSWLEMIRSNDGNEHYVIKIRLRLMNKNTREIIKKNIVLCDFDNIEKYEDEDVMIQTLYMK